MLYHSLEVKEVLKEKDSSTSGLSESEAKRRLFEYGPNALKAEKKETLLKILLRQFNETVIYILLAAAIISFIVGENLDGYTILAILIFNALLGFVQ